MSTTPTPTGELLAEARAEVAAVTPSLLETVMRCPLGTLHPENRRLVMLVGALAEVDRLTQGGCARDQRTTQFCAEAVGKQREIDRLTAENEGLRAERDNVALKERTKVMMLVASLSAAYLSKHGGGGDYCRALADVANMIDLTTPAIPTPERSES